MCSLLMMLLILFSLLLPFTVLFFSPGFNIFCLLVCLMTLPFMTFALLLSHLTPLRCPFALRWHETKSRLSPTRRCPRVQCFNAPNNSKKCLFFSLPLFPSLFFLGFCLIISAIRPYMPVGSANIQTARLLFLLLSSPEMSAILFRIYYAVQLTPVALSHNFF